MPPPRRVTRQQLEILLDFLEKNCSISKGLPATPLSQQAAKQKWLALAKQLNSVQGGELKTPERWKKYWFEWRHKCRKKAADTRRFQPSTDSNPNRLVPLDDLEVRVLELSGKGSATPRVTSSKQLDSFSGEESDSELKDNEPVEPQPAPVTVKPRPSVMTITDFQTHSDDNERTVTPPPKWALDLEKRRITAEERMAEALESIATTMRMQEERRAILEERIADSLTAVAGTVQDLNSGIQEALQHLQKLRPDIQMDLM